MIRAVLFDRDGTLIADAKGSGAVEPMPGAVQALRRLRAHGIAIGVVTNQPALARGETTPAALERTHRRIAGLIGAIDAWFVCPHAEDAGCGCRKPSPGLVVQAQQRFGISPQECVVVGDIGSDVEAAHNAGSRAVLVPTAVTRPEEIRQAPVVCRDLLHAAERILTMESAAI